MAQEAAPPVVREAAPAGQEAAPAPVAAPVSYADRPEVRLFVDEMVAKHGFQKEALLELFRQARQESAVLSAIRPAAHPSARSWQGFRKQFVDKKHIRLGKRFMEENRPVLQEASDKFGVPPSLITAIIGVETYYGRAQGRFQTLSALTTLAFDYPPRSELFRRELGEFLLLVREGGRDPLSYKGSYAGALGMPQFLPSSLRHYAVDGDGDGAIDLAGNRPDAIHSVAAYLAKHGWERGGSVAVPARIQGEAFQELADGNVDPLLTPATLRAHGITVPRRMSEDQKLSLVDLATPRKPTEYWLGFRNFYVITRYNKSSFYAMAVYQLAEKLRQPEVKKVRKVKSPTPKHGLP